MEQQKVQYMTAEEAKNIDPALIDSVSLVNGCIVKVGNQPTSCEFTEANYSNTQNVQICQHCGRYRKQALMAQNATPILRGKKGESQAAEQNVDAVEVEGQGEGEQKEALRAGLLNDILTGGENYEEGEMKQDAVMEPEQAPQEQIGEEQVNDNQYYNEQQYVPEQQNYVDENGYEYGEEYGQEYYDPNQYQNEGYADNNGNNLEDMMIYPEGQGQEMNNQEVPEQNIEQVPQENPKDYPQPEYPQEYPPEQIPQYEYPQEQEQYPQNEKVPEEQNQPYVPPQTQDYNPPNQEPNEQLPQQPKPQSQQPTQPIQPPVTKPVQPPMQKPVQPPMQKPVQPPRGPLVPPKMPATKIPKGQPPIPSPMPPKGKNIVGPTGKVPPRPLGPQKKCQFNLQWENSLDSQNQ